MKKNHVLVLTGGGYHDFESCGKIMVGLLEDKGYKVTHTTDRESISKNNLDGFETLVIYTQGDGLTAKQVKELDAWVKEGGSLVGIHCASDSFRNNRGYVELIGSEFIGHGPVHSFEVSPNQVDHYITRRMTPFSIVDELYILSGDSSRWTTLMTSNWKGKAEPMVYVREEGKGRIVYLALGHGVEAFTHPDFQKLLLRSIRWANGVKEKAPVRCGIIGYGGAFNMGKAHADVITKIPGYELTAICDLDTSRVQIAKTDFPMVETFTQVNKMLAQKDLDLVVLVTPHNTHGPLGLQCLKAGKHVVLEKPMCLTVKEATAMIDMAAKNKLMLSVFHNRRWDGDYTVLRQLVASGEIGEVFQVELYGGGYGHPGWWWRSDKAISGGAMYDWGAHFVDWILNLIPSKIESVTGFFQPKRVWHGVTNEDHTLAVIRFKNGAIASVEQSSIAAAGKDRWRVLGTKGSLSMKDYSDQGWTLTTIKDGLTFTGKVPFRQGDWAAYYRNVADHLLMGEELIVKGTEGRRVIGVIETAEKSFKAGKSLPVPFEED